ncbi:MAG TPA: YihY family inner membrane protein [Desulfuromonadales bacterium]|nr:YihY family inner membrane protein [Desulfuromonadales bacterium]
MQNPTIPDLLHRNSPGDSGDLKGRFVSFFQFSYSIWSNFLLHQGPLRASALTYTTVLSLVPFLAIAFSVLKGLGAQNALEPMLHQFAGDSEETITRIIAYVNNTNVKSMGAIGLVMLIVTVTSLMGSIDEAFNAVWGVTETRSLQRRFSDYLSVIIVGPILLLAATSMTSSLQSQWLVQWLIQNTYLGDAILMLFRLLPYLSVWIAMVFLYIFIPNTRVRFSSAVTGGIIAGTAWELAQWGYFHFQVGVANYNAIYGTLAALPVFLVWIYTSWIIVLFGLEIVRAHQHRRQHNSTECAAFQMTTTIREELALALLVQVSCHFQSGTQPTAQLLADELSVPHLQLEPLLDELEHLGFLVAIAGSTSGWLPARDPSELLVSDILAALRGVSPLPTTVPALQIANAIVQQGWNNGVITLEDLSLRDLLDKMAMK